MMTTEKNVDFKPYNSYLRTILDPRNNKQGIPDLDMTTAHIKRVDMNHITKAGSSGGGLFVILPNTKDPYPVKHFRWDDVRKCYVFSEAVKLTETLSESYETGRHVASIYHITSATTSGGQFNVSGVFASTQFQNLPRICGAEALTYEQVPAYNRNDVDVIVGLPVQEGIVAISHPDGNHEFRQFNTINRESVDSQLVLNSTSNQNGWALGTITATPTIIFDTNNAPGFLPPNLWGNATFELFLQYIGATNLNTEPFAQIDITIHRERMDINGLVTPENTVISRQLAIGATNGTIDIFAQDREGYTTLAPLEAPIERVTVAVSTFPSPTTLDVTLGAFTLKSNLYLQKGYLGPGTMIAYQGVTPGQELTVGGTAIYEVVPNAALSRQIPTQHTLPVENVFEMEFAEAALASGNFRMLYVRKEYDAFITSSRYYQQTLVENLATASNFTDFLSSIWSKIRPIMQRAAPVVGGALYGAPGSMIGTGLSQLMGEASYHGSRPASSYYSRCSSFEEEDTVSDNGMVNAETENVLTKFSFGDDESDFRHEVLPRAALLTANNPRIMEDIAKVEGLVANGTLTYQDLKNDNSTGIPISQVPMTGQKFAIKATQRARSGLDHSGEDAYNNFPVVDPSGTVTPGAVLFVPELNGFSGVGKFTRMSAKKNRSQIDIYQNWENADDAWTTITPTIAMELLSMPGLKGSILIKTVSAFSGGSAAAAVRATMRGLSLGAFITGHWTGGNRNYMGFLPDDVDVKAQFANSRNRPLIVSCEGTEDEVNTLNVNIPKQLARFRRGVYASKAALETEAPERPEEKVLVEGDMDKLTQAEALARSNWLRYQHALEFNRIIDPVMFCSSPDDLHAFQACDAQKLSGDKTSVQPKIVGSKMTKPKKGQPMNLQPKKQSFDYRINDLQGSLSLVEVMNYEYDGNDRGQASLRSSPNLISDLQKTLTDENASVAAHNKAGKSLANLIIQMKSIDDRKASGSSKKKKKAPKNKYQPKIRTVKKLEPELPEYEEDDFDFDY